MNKTLGYRPRRATGPRGMRYRRSVHGNAFQSESLARTFSSILENLTGETCEVIPSSPGHFFVMRDIGERWEKA